MRFLKLDKFLGWCWISCIRLPLPFRLHKWHFVMWAVVDQMTNVSMLDQRIESYFLLSNAQNTTMIHNLRRKCKRRRIEALRWHTQFSEPNYLLTACLCLFSRPFFWMSITWTCSAPTYWTRTRCINAIAYSDKYLIIMRLPRIEWVLLIHLPGT